MFCQLFSLQNKSFLCLQHIENKGFQTVIKHRLKAIQKHIKNELGNREKKHKKCTFRFEKMHISFSRLYLEQSDERKAEVATSCEPSDAAACEPSDKRDLAAATALLSPMP